MRKPDDAWRRRSGFSDTADGSRNIRHRADLSETRTPGDISAALYGPTVAPYTAEPALSAAEIRRRRHEREVRQAARRLEAAVDAELRRRGGR